jgi:hypothetical protein
MRLRYRWVPAASLLIGTLLGSVPAFADEVPITDEARQHFRAGVNLLEDPEGARYEEAYREFKAAYAAAASYKILGNLGLCAMKLERDGEAIEAYSKYLEHKDEIDPGEVKQISTDLQTLKSGAFHVSLTIQPTGAIVEDVRVPARGEPIRNQYGPVDAPLEIGIRPGHHQMRLRLAGYQDTSWEFDATAGGSDAKTFELKQVEAAHPVAETATPVEMRRPVPTSVYIGLGATGALAIGTVVTGIMAVGKKSDFDKANDGTNPSSAQTLKDDGQKMNLISDVLLAGTVVAAGVTTYLFAARPSVAAKGKEAAFVRLSPVPLASRERSVGGGALVLDGAF